MNSPQGSRCGPSSYYVDGSTGNLNFPAGQHQVRVQMGTLPTHDVQVDLYTSSIAERCFTWLSNTPFDVTFNGSASDAFIGIAFRDAGANPLWLLGTQLELSFQNLSSEPPCSAGTGTPIAPPVADPPPANMPPPNIPGCGTIQDVCTALAQLRLRLDAIYALVVPLQRYGKPFAWIRGPEFAELSGAGNVQISRLLGMDVYVVAPPPNAPVLPGNPPYLWDCGWMSINNADGMLEEKRVTRSGFQWFPRDMPLATSFNYDLTPGTVVTVVALQAEP